MSLEFVWLTFVIKQFIPLRTTSTKSITHLKTLNLRMNLTDLPKKKQNNRELEIHNINPF